VLWEKLSRGVWVHRNPLFILSMMMFVIAVQFLVLAFAHRHPALTRNAGNIALLQMAADAELLPQALAQETAAAYREYRRLQHRVRLTGATHARVEAAPQAELRASVAALWMSVFGGARDAIDRR